MLSNLKLIFVHGVNDQTTNYSHELYQKVLTICRDALKQAGQEQTDIERIVQHEVLWANLTTDLTNRYKQLASAPKQYRFSSFFIALCPLALLALLMKISFFRMRITPWLRQKLVEGIDPLAIQIMHYIKDKGDKQSGDMNILNDFDQNIKRIFSKSNDDVGYDARSGEGKNVIIIAHSLGSVIAFDYVMGFRKEYALDKDIRVKSLITMGSPIPVFISAMGHPDSDLAFPTNIKRWVNISNPLDGIARPIQAFFRNMPIVEEQVSSFGYDPISAHTGYWKDEKTAAIIAREVLAALKG